MEYVCETALDAHDALNDARNTAKLCLHMDMNKGLVEYPMLEKEFRKLPDNVVDKCRNGKTYKTREDALKDNSLLTFFAPNVENWLYALISSDKIQINTFALASVRMEKNIL